MCGLLWSVVLLALLVAALAVPWYTEAIMVNGVGEAEKDNKCSLVTLYSWNKAYCTTAMNTTACGPVALACPLGETYDWRDSTLCDVPGSHCHNRGVVFDASVACTAVAAIAAFVAVLGFVIRFCCEKREASSALLLAVGSIGLLCLTGGVVYFAVALPRAYSNDDVSSCTFNWALFTADATNNPCVKFFGHDGFGETTLSLLGLSAQKYWGPIGWICAAVAIPIYLLVLCLSYNPAPTRSLQSQNNGPEAVYTRYM